MLDNVPIWLDPNFVSVLVVLVSPNKLQSLKSCWITSKCSWTKFGVQECFSHGLRLKMDILCVLISICLFICDVLTGLSRSTLELVWMGACALSVEMRPDHNATHTKKTKQKRTNEKTTTTTQGSYIHYSCPLLHFITGGLALHELFNFCF